MKQLIATALTVIAITTSAHAQQPVHSKPGCGYEQALKHVEQRDPDFKAYTAYIYRQSSALAAKGTGEVYKIPVVFHIVYHTTEQNLPDSVILNQMNILNKAYRMQNANIGHLRSVFQPLAADAEIEFVLASKNPQGNTTNGITRTYTALPYFGYDIGGGNGLDMDSLERMKVTARGGIDAWPTDKYLNIWVGDFRYNSTDEDAGLQGYATPPNNPYPPNNWTPIPPYIDGVAMHFQAIGSNNATRYVPAYVASGIYTVHEVGHYLGLRHIWGEGNTNCDTAGDDGINDTPFQATSSDIEEYACPSPDQNTCGAGVAGDLPDLWENYMDYGADSCRVMFTHGQVSLMHYVLDNQRMSLVNQPTDIVTVPVMQNGFTIYPQPASDRVSVSISNPINHLRIMNMAGQTVMELHGKGADQKSYNISALPSGLYIMLAESNHVAYAQRMVVQH
jgi:hypothetical protein